jgi:hypothetical protein
LKLKHSSLRPKSFLTEAKEACFVQNLDFDKEGEFLEKEKD